MQYTVGRAGFPLYDTGMASYQTLVLQPYRSLLQRIDSTPMYRVVTWALSLLVAWSLLLSLLGQIRPTISELFLSLLVVLVAAVGANLVCARVWRIRANHESAVITALLLFFIVLPAATLPQSWIEAIQAGVGDWVPRAVFDYGIIALAAFLAVVSKFLVAIRRQHIFNAAAFGAAVLSVSGVHEFTWWIGTPEMFLPLLAVGIVVVHKVRKWEMVLAFLAVGFVVFLFDEWRYEQDLWRSAQFFWLSYSSLFLACFMLTEPFTTPPTRRLQVVYGALVGFLAHTIVFYPYMTMTPELALLVGNLVLYPATLRRKLFLQLQECRTLAQDTYEFIFAKPAGLSFIPGQYMEWELPHPGMDRRGQRRYFTIASAPSEATVRLAVKILPEGGSSYKDALLALQPGEQVIASQRAGDFQLPADTTTKLALVAGGIGVTPFRSFVQHMRDTGAAYDTVLYYCNNTRADVAYRDLFDTAADELSWQTVYVYAKEEATAANEAEGYVTAAMIREHTPDFADRTWYLSGPPGMVHAYETLLQKELGLPARQIVKDFFPGLA